GAIPEASRILIVFDMPVITSPPLPPTPEVDEEEPASVEGADESPSSQPVLPDLVDPVAETLAALRRKGFGRLYIDGQTASLEDVDASTLKDRASLQVIVDRLKIEGDLRTRLTDSIETAYQ